MRIRREVDLRKAAIDAVEARIDRLVQAAVLNDEVEAHKAQLRMHGLADIGVAQDIRDGAPVGPEVAQIVESELSVEEVEH